MALPFGIVTKTVHKTLPSGGRGQGGRGGWVEDLAVVGVQGVGGWWGLVVVGV